MTAIEKKALLKKLIEAEHDPNVLELVNNVLQRCTRSVAFSSDLVKRIVRSEEDLRAGRFQTMDEFERDIDTFIDKLDTERPKSKTL